MDLMRRHLILASHPMEYGGILVWKDNCYYATGGNGAAESFVTDPDWFIAGVFDTGSTSSKSYTWINPGRQGHDAAVRFFNDLSASSVQNYPAAFSGGSPLTFSIPGQFILFSIYKPKAVDIYLKQGSIYIFKGSNVT